MLIVGLFMASTTAFITASDLGYIVGNIPAGGYRRASPHIYAYTVTTGLASVRTHDRVAGGIVVGCGVVAYASLCTVANLRVSSTLLKVAGVLNLMGLVLCLTGVVRSVQLANNADKVRRCGSGIHLSLRAQSLLACTLNRVRA
jgi:hypothetical protein